MTCEIVFEYAITATTNVFVKTSPFSFFDIKTGLFGKIKFKNNENVHYYYHTINERVNELRQAQEETKLLLIQFPLSRDYNLNFRYRCIFKLS